ncbi:MAG TPA: MoaD/ThiS family protein [Cyclobacteriaceae bacterium]|nr:MoaD/ThiS family protein [Cyclobacteriaceae bacterium]
MIRVVLPFHLRNLARVGGEISVEVKGEVTVESVVAAIEMQYPMLTGTIRDHTTKKRRAFLRFYACGEDYSLVSGDTRLPDKVLSGDEPFLVIGAVAGG